MLEEYDKLHKSVWPDVLRVISSCNLQNYSIFRLDDVLFTYYEYAGNNYEADIKRMDLDPVIQKWNSITDPCFIKTWDDEFYKKMKEVFHLD
jgi:L-rhamnose mutarotase